MSIMKNRLANCHNRYQGTHRRVLCVCSAGMLRAPTIAWVLSNPPYECNTRAAGVVAEYALVPVDECLLEWADYIVCADKEHLEVIESMLPSDHGKTLYCLGIKDMFEHRESELVNLIRSNLKDVEFPTKSDEYEQQGS